MRALCLFLSVPEELLISESTETNVKQIISKYNVLKMAESKARLKQELQAKRRKEEMEQQQHKEELLVEKKRLEELKLKKNREQSEEHQQDNTNDTKSDEKQKGN